MVFFLLFFCSSLFYLCSFSKKLIYTHFYILFLLFSTLKMPLRNQNVDTRPKRNQQETIASVCILQSTDSTWINFCAASSSADGQSSSQFNSKIQTEKPFWMGNRLSEYCRHFYNYFAQWYFHSEMNHYFIRLGCARL